MKHYKNVQALALPSVGLGMRALIIAGAVAALTIGLLALGWSGSARAQTCEANDLGTLGAEAGTELTVNGRWTTGNCDSRFRTASDAHTYRFEVVEGGRIRIDLISAEGDPFLYLLTEDGLRLADNDDGGAGLDARVERDLAPGVYIVEATTVGGRSRGPADFPPFHQPCHGLRAGSSRLAGTGPRSDRIGILDARHLRLALRSGTPGPQLSVLPAAGRSRAHRPDVGKRRPCAIFSFPHLPA